MTFAGLLTRAVEIHHRTQDGPVDEDNVPTWSETVSDVQAYIEPLGSLEDLADRQAQIGTHLGIFPAGTAIDGSDEVVSEGHTYRVIGPVRRFNRPSTGEHHVEATLQEESG